jgi:uncharacterized coiled-coil DUF342 family protein
MFNKLSDVLLEKRSKAERIRSLSDELNRLSDRKKELVERAAKLKEREANIRKRISSAQNGSRNASSGLKQERYKLDLVILTNKLGNVRKEMENLELTSQKIDLRVTEIGRIKASIE